MMNILRPTKGRDNSMVRRFENPDPDRNKLSKAFDVIQFGLSLVLKLL